MGTNFDDVNNATGGTPLGSASYSPGTLELEKVYYWRVDEFDPPFTHRGDVWSFTTTDFILVDDFESYNDIDPPDAASNRIFDKWVDDLTEFAGVDLTSVNTVTIGFGTKGSPAAGGTGTMHFDDIRLYR